MICTEDEFYDEERSDPVQNVPSSDSSNASATTFVDDVVPLEISFPHKEELRCLIRGEVPMALKGEFWQSFRGCEGMSSREVLSKDTTLG